MKIASWKEQDRALSQRAKAFGISWSSDVQGTFNEGRNKAKAARRAMRFGVVAATPAKPPKAVRPAFRVRLPIVRRNKVLSHAPRNRPLTPRERMILKVFARVRDRIARASRRYNARTGA